MSLSALACGMMGKFTLTSHSLTCRKSAGQGRRVGKDGGRSRRSDPQWRLSRDLGDLTTWIAYGCAISIQRIISKCLGSKAVEI